VGGVWMPPSASIRDLRTGTPHEKTHQPGNEKDGGT
jgi:hypothetical protein